MKNKLFIVVIFAAIILLAAKFGKIKGKITGSTGATGATEEEVKRAVKASKMLFPVEVVRNAEKIARLETAHFKSGNFQRTNGAGFEAFKSSFPFGWTSLADFWKTSSVFEGMTTTTETENQTGLNKMFIVWPSFYACFLSICKLMELRGNDPGKYFSNDDGERERYRNLIAGIKPKFTNETA